MKPHVTDPDGPHESVPPVHLPVSCHQQVAAAGHDQCWDCPAQLGPGLGLRLEYGQAAAASEVQQGCHPPTVTPHATHGFLHLFIM